MKLEKTLNMHNVMNKRKFKYLENPIWIGNIDIDIILISNKVYFGKDCYKYFDSQKDNK